MRVAIVADELTTRAAGTEGQIHFLVNNLRRVGVDVVLVTLRGAAPASVAGSGVHTIEMGIGSLRKPASWMRALHVCRQLKTRKIQVAHIFLNDASLLLPLILRSCGIAAIVARRDLGYWYGARIRAIFRLNSFFVALYHANCDAVRLTILRDECRNPEKVVVVRNAVDLECGSELAESPCHLNGVSLSQLDYMVIVANIRPLKRHGDAIAALSVLRRSFPSLNLVIVGADRIEHDGSQVAKLRALANRLNVADVVHFAGPVANPKPLVARARICLLLSETEGLSNTLIEYMCLSKAIVATAVGGSTELITHRETGLLVRAGDIEAITSAVRELLLNPDLSTTLGRNAAHLVRNLLDPTRILDEHLSMYQRALSALVPGGSTKSGGH